MKSTLITLPLYMLSNLLNFSLNRDPWNIVKNIFGINTNTTNHEIIKCNSSYSSYLNCKNDEEIIKI